MLRFLFQFDPLLRYRRHRRDLVRQVLARILDEASAVDADVRALQDRRDRQLDELRRLGRGGALDVDRAASRRFHTAQLDVERRLAERRRETILRQLDTCRALLVDADRDVRVLERLRDRRLAEHRLHEERRAQLEIEDAWSARRQTHGRT